eukprot:COSAG05_NODE_8805_length_670_cov_0.746060_1_plen_27_part_01
MYTYIGSTSIIYIIYIYNIIYDIYYTY